MRLGLFTLLLCLIPALAQTQEILLNNLEGAVSIDASNNHLFILEQKKNRFLKLNFDGVKLDSIGSIGSGDYQFEDPSDLDVSNGLRIYVSDTGNNRIQVYDRRLQYLSSIKASNAMSFEPTEILVNAFAEVLVYNKRDKEIVIFDEFGQQRPRFNMPREITLVNDLKSDGNQLYVLDTKNEIIHELGLSGLYRSFYPAETVESIAFKKDVLLLLDWNGIRDADRPEYVIEFENMIVKDAVYVRNEGLFVLTDSRLILYPF